MAFLSRSLSFGLIAGGVGYLAYQTLLRSSYSFTNKVVVITGGSRGLGLEMARRFCAEGARVAICSRHEDEVERAVNELAQYGADILGFPCDLTQPDQIQKFATAVLDHWGQIDVLINNAGVIQVGPQECMTESDYELALQTHLWAPLRMTNAVLPQMKQRGAGRIVNIASVGGRVSVPHLLPYCVSKFALVGWSEGLSSELQKFGITVTTVSPGLMRTGSARRALFKGEHQAEYAWFSIGASMPLVSINSELAAQRIVEACRRGDAAIMVSGLSAVATRLHGLCPGGVSAALGWANQFFPPPSRNGLESKPGWQCESPLSPSWLTKLNEAAAVRNNEI